MSGVLIAVAVLYFSQIIVQKIQERERQIAGLYARAIEYLANDENATGEYGFIFTEVIDQIDFPIIATNDKKDRVEFSKNVDLDSTRKMNKQDTIRLLKLANEMSQINTPIKVAYKGQVLNYVHYGQSKLVTQLKMLPFFEFLIGGIFIILGYIGFSYIKKTEQSNIWVGLSRETAHQLGTPLSSLMGWTEMLKTIEEPDPSLSEITTEIENDIDKLNTIAGRFSKIGSQPKLDNISLLAVIKKVSDYFEKRIPSLVTADGLVTKKVLVTIDGSTDIHAKVNTDLFEWVIENLMKNSLDAMDKQNGKINFQLTETSRDVCIDITDNGKGIDKKFKKDVFRPGYSTKKRGWGLGLSLAKRIIENYHNGKLVVAESTAGKGTTFRIKLPKK
ncbi:ATP-binding protein [soil metagenome]